MMELTEETGHIGERVNRNSGKYDILGKEEISC